jgi:hypothetical protein
MPEDQQTAAVGVIGLILKVRGNSVTQDEAELILE